MRYLLNLVKRINPLQYIIKNPSNHLFIYANQKNAGDLLSARGVQMAVGVKGREQIIEKDLNKLKSILYQNKSKNLKLIIGGGGLLKDSFEEFWQIVLKSGLQYICFGIGVCDIKKKNSLLPDEIFKNIVTNAYKIWVRDSRTSAIIESKCGIKVEQTLCPSVLYIYNKYKDLSYKKIYKKLVLLYSHHKGLLHAAKKEDNFVRTLVKEICRNNNFIFLEVNNICKNPDKLLRQYASADIVVSTRLHGCIFSYALNKPFVAISADEKIESFVFDYCDAEVLDLEQLTMENLNKAIQQRIYSLSRKEDFLYNIQKIIEIGHTIRAFLSE